SYLPDAAAAQPGVTLRRILSHAAGLPLDIPQELAPYQHGLSWPVLANACLQTPLSHPPATHIQYSNVGYGLLALIVEARTGYSFSEALRELVLDPLGVEGYLGQEPPRQPVKLSGIRGRQAGSDLEPFNSPFWRALAMPWAGLLTTAEGALRLVCAFAGEPEGFLQPKTAAEARRNQNGDLGGGYIRPLIWPRCPWGLGPDIHGEKQPHWVPSTASPDSYGHAGASGSVAWIDPRATVAWAIMGTRIAASGWLLRRGPSIAEAILREQSALP
ncbi:MAG: serine hydrolase domain-containing protein, partial [Chloroflexota bacterium]